ncbi:unnamed protein product [Anisakis simplex]|uniref:mRNA_decap_C domain-containing protein n=1 Tax=Anisakis simplex TaxID=6269 RepID=A0A158PPR7_ANISI|nr:unnamed protein product [Anisakis simplex]
MNLTSVQRIDPCAVAIIDKSAFFVWCKFDHQFNVINSEFYGNSFCFQSTHAALYSYDAAKEGWTKTAIEGPLLIYRRADRPTHSMIIANRQSLCDHIEPIIPSLRIWEKSPYIFFKKMEVCLYRWMILNVFAENEITGLWFYEREDCVRIYKLLRRLLSETSTPQPPAPATASSNTTSVQSIQDASFDVLSLLSCPQQTQNVSQQITTEQNANKPQTLDERVSELPSKDGSCGTFEMPAMLQKLLCEESGIAKRTMPLKGALNADQIEKHLVQGDSNLLMDKFLTDPKLSTHFSSASLAALSTTAVGGSDTGTLPDEATGAGDQSFSTKNRNVTELKRSCSVDDTTNQIPIAPLNKEQMLQAMMHLLRTDDDFVAQLHRAYVDSLNYRLGL